MEESTLKVLSFPLETPSNALEIVLRRDAQKLLMEAIEAEVAEYMEARKDQVDAEGRRLVVRNGYLPAREIQTPLGDLTIRQSRVRDRRGEGEREVFTSKILPPYLRRTPSLEDLIPWLYLKGMSTGEFGEALQALVGADAKGLSASTITRLKGSGSTNSKNGRSGCSKVVAMSTFGPTASTSTSGWSRRRARSSAIWC